MQTEIPTWQPTGTALVPYSQHTEKPCSAVTTQQRQSIHLGLGVASRNTRQHTTTRMRYLGDRGVGLAAMPSSQTQTMRRSVVIAIQSRAEPDACMRCKGAELHASAPAMQPHHPHAICLLPNPRRTMQALAVHNPGAGRPDLCSPVEGAWAGALQHATHKTLDLQRVRTNGAVCCPYPSTPPHISSPARQVAQHQQHLPPVAPRKTATPNSTQGQERSVKAKDSLTRVCPIRTEPATLVSFCSRRHAIILPKKQPCALLSQQCPTLGKEGQAVC